jgi:FixJ family two-component response regulator
MRRLVNIPLIAIVDDDADIRTAMSALIRALGYEVRGYPSAEAFLASSSAGTPDCLIVDVQMPGMTGPQLQQRLLLDARVPPMIFITAFPDAEIRQQVLAAGAVAVLGKPCDGKSLVDTIEAALAMRSKSGGR